jgi:predicted nucleotidyltransferase
MVAMRDIERFGQQIGDRFGAEQVILFGSYAKAIATKDSDVDLLVVMPFAGRGVDESVKIRMTLKPSFPVDLLVRTSEKIKQRIQAGDTFLRTILEDGKVLYEARHI